MNIESFGPALFARAMGFETPKSEAQQMVDTAITYDLGKSGGFLELHMDRSRKAANGDPKKDCTCNVVTDDKLCPIGKLAVIREMQITDDPKVREAMGKLYDL